MDGKLLAQLACVAFADAEGIRDPYRWPPRPELSEEERREVDRLTVLGRRLMYRAIEKGQTETGTAALFGEDS